MRIAEFMALDDGKLIEAIHEVVEAIREDSAGADHLRISAPNDSAVRLILMLRSRVRARQLEYGPNVGVDHGLMMAFRIGAAYGRRVPK